MNGMKENISDLIIRPIFLIQLICLIINSIYNLPNVMWIDEAEEQIDSVELNFLHSIFLGSTFSIYLHCGWRKRLRQRRTSGPHLHKWIGRNETTWVELARDSARGRCQKKIFEYCKCVRFENDSDRLILHKTVPSHWTRCNYCCMLNTPWWHHCQIQPGDKICGQFGNMSVHFDEPMIVNTSRYIVHRILTKWNRLMYTFETWSEPSSLNWY